MSATFRHKVKLYPLFQDTHVLQAGVRLWWKAEQVLYLFHDVQHHILTADVVDSTDVIFIIPGDDEKVDVHICRGELVIHPE